MQKVASLRFRPIRVERPEKGYSLGLEYPYLMDELCSGVRVEDIEEREARS